MNPLTFSITQSIAKDAAKKMGKATSKKRRGMLMKKYSVNKKTGKRTLVNVRRSGQFGASEGASEAAQTAIEAKKKKDN